MNKKRSADQTMWFIKKNLQVFIMPVNFQEKGPKVEILSLFSSDEVEIQLQSSFFGCCTARN